MAVSIQQRRTKEGVAYVTATVRVSPYPSASRTFPNKRDAKEWGREHERELKKQADRGAIRRDVPKLTIGELLKEFLDDPETQALGYYDDLSLLCAWWTGHCGPERIMTFNVLKVREARDVLRKGRAPGTVNRYLSAMRSAWNWGRAAGLVPDERAWPSRVMLTEPKGRVRYLSDSELAMLLKTASEFSAVMHAAIVVSICTGVRRSELLRLQWTDIDLDKQRLSVGRSKNGQSRAVFLPASAVEALRVLKRAPVVGKTVFLDEEGQPIEKDWLVYRWRIIRTAAKLVNFRWHDLRHSCASYLAQHGATLLEVGSVLGHKSPSATMRYAHLVEAKPVTGHSQLDEKLRGAPK